ncbi:MAG: NifB/NifX family molybdenum-iron cluster-binding protein [Desulfatiglandaceae bacterium]|jgi:predicted Fe-Mo cluster-binding NifX family protein
MKIAVTAKGTDLDAAVDPRFGRAAYILIVDSETFAFRLVDNQANVNAFKGAGIQAASSLSEQGAEVLLTGYCGPNAFKTLAAAKVKVANDANVYATVREAVEAFTQGKLPYASEANVEGHW